MREFIKQHYWWPKIKKSIRDFIIDLQGGCKDNIIGLSGVLGRLAYYPESIESLSMKNINCRVSVLENYIKGCEPYKIAEFMLMKKLIQKYVSSGEMYLVAIECIWIMAINVKELKAILFLLMMMPYML